jgi:Ribbon-helix-helix domain
MMYTRIHHMRRTTIFVDEAVDHDLHSLASQKGVPVSELVREALERYLADQSRQKKFKLRFLGAGRSGRSNISKRHEDLLWRELNPHEADTRSRANVENRSLAVAAPSQRVRAVPRSGISKRRAKPRIRTTTKRG